MLSLKTIYFSFLLLALSLLFSCSTQKKLVKTYKKPPIVAHQGVVQQGSAHESYSTYNSDVKEYISKYAAYAVKEMKEFGVPASVILAQGIHESRAGKSLLTQEANNHFGVKCTSDWTGPSYHIDDDSPNECFRKYDSPEASYDDHMKFLQRPRYAELFKLEKGDYKGWAYGLKRCGYATNPRYAEILISMIERYNLDRFDHGAEPSTESSYLAAKRSKKNIPVEASVNENIQQPVLVNSTSNTNPSQNIQSSTGSYQKNVIQTDTIHRKVYVTDTVYQYTYKKANASQTDATGSSVERNGISNSGANLIITAPKTAAFNKSGQKNTSIDSDSSLYKKGSSVGSLNQSQNTNLDSPASTTSTSSQQNADAQTLDGTTVSSDVYTVKQGDTLYGISRRFKLKVEDLRRINSLPDYKIKIDQVIKLK